MIGSGPPLGQIGGTYRGSFRVKSPTTGLLVNADSAPTGTLVVNGSDTGVTVTITNPATGRYAVSCSLAGRSLLDVCWVRINATAGGVADEDALPAFVVALDAAGLLVVDVEDFGGVGADPSQLWDVLQGNQTLDVNAAWIGGSAVAANAGTNLSTFFDVSPTLVNALGTSILFVDTTTSSRASQGSVNNLNTQLGEDFTNLLAAVGNVPGLVWASGARTLTAPPTGIDAQVWGYLAASAAVANSMGALVVANLDAKLSDVRANTAGVPGLLEDDGSGGKRFKASVFSQLVITGDGGTPPAVSFESSEGVVLE